MASGGHMLEQQKANVGTQLKRLINQDLKEICRGYGKAVSGNKVELQRRCIEILDEVVAKGDPVAFDELRYRVQNKGHARPGQTHDSSASSYGSPTATHQQHSMPPGRGGAAATQQRLPQGGKYFTESPFYEIVDTVLRLTDLPGGAEMPQNRNTVKATLHLSAEQAQRLSGGGDMRLIMYCGQAQNMSAYSKVDISFPNQIEVKINDDDIKWNYKGLKNKPGSTKPADITQKIRAKPNYPNQVSVTYALTTKRYAFVIYMVRYVSATALTERIKHQNVIPKDQVIQEMRKANADPDIEATSTYMSLKDPISTVRITLPVRGTTCTHTQCFDAAMFMQLVEQAPQWTCPICTKGLSYQSLCVDKYFEDILERTPKSVERVTVEPDGEWRVIKEETDEDRNGAPKPRASYDDDFDDDLVEIDGPANKPLNGVKRESQPPSMLSPMVAPSFSMNTPPLSSREPSVAQSIASGARAGNKRPASSVIDLTLSDDDDDDPPRPAKRQTTTTQNNQGTQRPHSAQPVQQQYHTPSSLPDHTRYQPTHHGFRQADNYRPSTSDPYSRPTSHAGPPATTASPLGTAGQLHSQYLNGASLSNSNSPAQQQQQQQPSGYTFGARPSASPWPVQHSRSPSQPPNGMHSFSGRPPPSLGGVTSPQPQQSGAFRLPSMQTHLSLAPPPPPSSANDGFYGSWRSDRGYSGSPG